MALDKRGYSLSNRELLEAIRQHARRIKQIRDSISKSRTAIDASNAIAFHQGNIDAYAKILECRREPAD